MKKQSEWSKKDKKKYSQWENSKNFKKSWENRFQKDEKKSRYKNYANKSKDTSNLEKIVWVYSSAKNNDFWFVDVEWVEKWYFVYPKNLNWALDGDEVEAVLQTFNRRKEAIITKIIKRADRTLVWKIEFVKDFAFVILDNPSFKNDVYIPNSKLRNFKPKVKNNQKVAIKITNWSWKNPEWTIVEILWDEDKKWVDILSIALEWWARIKFPEYVLQEAEKLTFQEEKHRIDLTQNLVFTIDWDDAKDLDDAISLEKIGNNYKLIVSIADVANYVEEGTSLDREALKRWNSIYLVDRVIPMLPEKLSNDLCSLNPNTKKLTLSCEMILDNQGNVTSKKVYESMISSKFRLTYREVQEMLDWKLNIWDSLKFWWIISKDLFETVKLTNELKLKISSRKNNDWILNFDFPETKIVLDEEWNPIDFQKYERYESMKIIEEFMILANSSVSELFSKTSQKQKVQGRKNFSKWVYENVNDQEIIFSDAENWSFSGVSNFPFVYRIHPVPNEDDIEKLRNTLNIFWLKLPYKTITPKIIANILEEIKWNKKEKLLQKLILRSLEKAIYSVENEGHFWLNLEFYSHFTSPIRRYPDLQIHRIIKEKLAWKFTQAQKKHYENILPWVSKKTSDTERQAEKLEYAVRDLMMCKYFSNKIWEEYVWEVSGTIAAWFFVELENTAEWLVLAESLSKNQLYKNPEFIESEMKFLCSWWNFIQVWDIVKVKILEVDLVKRRLNFDFIEKIIQ